MSTKYLSDEDIRGVIDETLHKLCYPEKSKLISFDYNSKLTSTIGYARSFPMPHISLSPVLFAVAPPSERYNTIVHEVCHLCAVFKDGHIAGRGHGANWAILMAKCGLPAIRCHDIVNPVKAFKRAQKAKK